MAIANAWPIIHAEREALIADLEPLTDAQWETPSMCGGWSVRQVLAHMAATAASSPRRFFVGIVTSGFRFEAMAARDVASQLGRSPAETLSRFKALLTSSSHPPGPTPTWVGEVIVHGEDIRRPLGLTRTYPTAALVGVADFYKGSNLIIGAKRRVTGLGLRATDASWSTGSGPEVSGPLLSLILAMTGRPAGLDDLSGDGVATLKSRM